VPLLVLISADPQSSCTSLSAIASTELAGTRSESPRPVIEPHLRLL
jgi:hypothetical protein